eukprot:2820759-Rhodomonas_salina.1
MKRESEHGSLSVRISFGGAREDRRCGMVWYTAKASTRKRIARTKEWRDPGMVEDLGNGRRQALRASRAEGPTPRRPGHHHDHNVNPYPFQVRIRFKFGDLVVRDTDAGPRARWRRLGPRISS